MITRAAVLIASHSGKGQREVKNKAEADRMLLPVPYYCLVQQDNLFSVVYTCLIWHCWDTGKPIWTAGSQVRFHLWQAVLPYSLEKQLPELRVNLRSWAASADGTNSFLASLAVSASCHPSNGTKRINKRPQPVKIDTREAGVEKNMAN